MPKAIEQATTVEAPTAPLVGEAGPPAALAVGSAVGFVLFPNELVPASVALLRSDERLDVRATIMTVERRRNPNPDSINPFINAWVESLRLQQRVRRHDPPVQRDNNEYPVEQFTLVYASGVPGGPLVAGTWFDLVPWTVELVATKYEERGPNKIVVVPFEQRNFGRWDGGEYAACYRTFDVERRSEAWDKLELNWTLRGSE